MKNITLASFALAIALNSFANTIPNIKEGPKEKEVLKVKKGLEQSFENNFPNAENVRWIDDAEGYTVSFTANKIVTRVNYDLQGKFTGSLRNYSKDLLPYYLVDQLKQKYPGESIFGITEITTPTSINYFVKLEDAKSWTTVVLDNDGGMTVTEQFNKSN